MQQGKGSSESQMGRCAMRAQPVQCSDTVQAKRGGTRAFHRTLALLACPADRFLMARAAAWPPESLPPRNSSIRPAIMASSGCDRCLQASRHGAEQGGVRGSSRRPAA